MKWPRMMLAEMRFAMSLLRLPGSWLTDKHLRTGYILSMLAFIPAVIAFLLLYRKSFALAFGVVAGLSLIANMIWLGYAAHSRAKEGDHIKRTVE